MHSKTLRKKKKKGGKEKQTSNHIYACIPTASVPHTRIGVRSISLYFIFAGSKQKEGTLRPNLVNHYERVIEITVPIQFPSEINNIFALC